MGRGKVSVDIKEVIKVIRGELHGGARLEDYAQADNEKVMDNYSQFIAALLKVCPYPSQGLIEDACKQAWDDKSDASVTFASRIIKAITHCRQKVKSMKTGIKLGPGCTQICKAIRISNRGLKRKRSDESASSKKKGKGGKLQSKENVSKTAATSTSSSSKTDTASILALYGIKPSNDPVLPTLDDAFDSWSSTSCCEISDDDAIIFEAPDQKKPGPTTSGKDIQEPSAVQPFGEPWLCYKDMTLKRMGADGQMQLASMSAGKSGFAVARFPDTTVEIQTELPNLSLELQQLVFKKPASATKAPKKAKKKAKPKVSKDADTDTSEDMVALQPKKVTPAKSANLKKIANTAVSSTKAAPQAVSKKTKIETGAASSTGPAPEVVIGAKPQNRPFQSEVYGQCKAEYYTAKSYIRHVVDDKWKLIIQSTHARHWGIISSLSALVEAGKSKDELLAERVVLEAEDVD